VFEEEELDLPFMALPELPVEGRPPEEPPLEVSPSVIPPPGGEELPEPGPPDWSSLVVGTKAGAPPARLAVTYGSLGFARRPLTAGGPVQSG
jgi:hypothetical protein